MLFLPTCEPSLSFHLFVAFSVSSMSYIVSECRSFRSFVKFIPRCFLLSCKCFRNFSLICHLLCIETLHISVINFFYFLFIYLFICFLGPHPWRMEVPRLEVESELQLPAYATATVMREPSQVCYLQLMATPDPRPTERGQGTNRNPHGY